MQQRQVELFHFAAAELFCQGPVGGVVAGHQKDTRGQLVKPMHNARSKLAGGSGQSSVAMQQRVDQCAPAQTGSGVHSHAGRFVHRDHVVIFIENFYRNRLGNGSQRRPGNDFDRNLLTSTNLCRRAGRRTGKPYVALRNQFLDARTTELVQTLGQVAVEPLPGRFGFDRKRAHRWRRQSSRRSSGRRGIRNHILTVAQLSVPRQRNRGARSRQRAGCRCPRRHNHMPSRNRAALTICISESWPSNSSVRSGSARKNSITPRANP